MAWERLLDLTGSGVWDLEAHPAGNELAFTACASDLTCQLYAIQIIADTPTIQRYEIGKVLYHIHTEPCLTSLYTGVITGREL